MIMGTGRNSNTLYLIDFGLSKPWRTKHGKHTPYSEDRSLTGTARYASINNHLGYEQSRRDDMESLAYMFIYFLKGKLPWQGFNRQNNAEKFDQILQRKRDMTPVQLCEGLPLEFASFLTYCQQLEFEEAPNYEYWRREFQDVMRENGLVYDGEFDWFKRDK